MKFNLAQSFGSRGRVFHVHDEENALFDPGTVVASGHVGQQHVLAQQAVHFEHEADHEGNGEAK